MALGPIPLVAKLISESENAPDGSIPVNLFMDGESTVVVIPQPAPAVDPAPTDAAAVASDLQALVTTLIASGVLTA